MGRRVRLLEASRGEEQDQDRGRGTEGVLGKVRAEVHQGWDCDVGRVPALLQGHVGRYPERRLLCASVAEGVADLSGAAAAFFLFFVLLFRLPPRAARWALCT